MHNGRGAYWIFLFSCNNFEDVSEMHDGGDADPDEEKVEGAHHVRHVCGTKGR